MSRVITQAAHLAQELLHGPSKALPPLNVLQQLQNGSSCSCLLLLFFLPVQGGRGQQLPARLEGEAGGPGLNAPLVPTCNLHCRSSAPRFCLHHKSATWDMHCSLWCLLQPRLLQFCPLLLPVACHSTRLQCSVDCVGHCWCKED